MDDPKIRLYPDRKSDGRVSWNWELLLEGEKTAGGKSRGTQDTAFSAARQALAKARQSRSKPD